MALGNSCNKNTNLGKWYAWGNFMCNVLGNLISVPKYVVGPLKKQHDFR